MAEIVQDHNTTLESSTYEILQKRLQQNTQLLRERLAQLNETRKEVFGGIETALVATERIHTHNNCVPYDMASVGTRFLFGYNVHLGLKTAVDLSDVFSVYAYHERSFQELGYEMIQDDTFANDFQKLYKYYKDTKFIRFVVQGPYLYMVFRISKSLNDIKAFKWEISDEELTYLDNRSEHELSPPEQHDFVWQRTTRDDQRPGPHPHVSIQDRVFVETLNGDLTIKVEDNTETGKGIYQEEVENADQTLDDAEIYYALLGNIVLLKIRPYQEKAYRHIAYNAKLREARRIDAVQQAGVLLPDDQGLLFPNGYYLQTGEFKQFDNELTDLRFEQKIVSPNGEDFLYVFYQPAQGIYQLLPYNIIAQTVQTPIICHGYALFENGELCYFNADATPKKHHVIRIWQTPYIGPNYTISTQSDSYLYKIGNQDIVRAMAECQALIALVEKGENYQGLYLDLQKQATTVLDAYYWLDREETFRINEPLTALRDTAAAATDEYEKVVSIRKNTQQQVDETLQAAEQLVGDLKRRSRENIQEFVEALARLRTLRGEVISLKDLRYVDERRVQQHEDQLSEVADQISQECVRFLLREDALAPYYQQVQEIEDSITNIKKVVEADEVEAQINQLSSDLNLLIEIVSNLEIADATQTTQIVDNISATFSELNKIKAHLKRRRQELLGQEGRAEFHAQSKLINQALVNYLDVSDTPEKCDEYAAKLMVQLEELEGKFATFDEFVTQIMQLREEVYNAFEARKVQLIEARNKRANTLLQSADRILKAVHNRVNSFENVNELNGYFAADLMVEKVREIIQSLQQIGDTVKADEVQSRLKSTREDAVRQLKDRSELYVDGEGTIRFGQHVFSVNTADLALTTVVREGKLCYHLTGTNFYEPMEHAQITEYRTLWDQALVSENEEVYRAEYLAFQIFYDGLRRHLPDASLSTLAAMSTEDLRGYVQQYMRNRYEEGYNKGVHDQDATQILSALLHIYHTAGLLRYPTQARTAAALFWLHYLDQDQKSLLNYQLKGAGAILQVFPESIEFDPVLEALQQAIAQFATQTELFATTVAPAAGEYLFYELIHDDHFAIDQLAVTLRDQFMRHLEHNKATAAFNQSVESLQDSPWVQYELIRKWVRSFAKTAEQDPAYADEVALLLFSNQLDTEHIAEASLHQTLTGMQGNHPLLPDGTYALHYNTFLNRLQQYTEQAAPAFRDFQQLKRQLVATFTEDLQLESFQPRVMSSFVRNQLIDQVYLPLIGANLAKQIGTAGESKRTDLMSMLLLISPPGYGKTTLMEYLANRLGIIFMKINGPAIGHAVTAVDPAQAPNAGAREELEKLNLAFEMGDNVMIYLDDIQHCHPEFLQKFISLCDAQRKIEGVYKGRSKTYDFRGKKVCVVMAGNPYTESGDKFQIPDMLANRADIYNLGDIVGDSAEAFKMSYLENCLTSNPVLNKLASQSQQDVYTLIKMAQTGGQHPGEQAGATFETNHSAEAVREYVAVLQKLLTVRDVILRVNVEYIHSAAQADEYRTEPPFKLQGSYRDMNKLAERVVPVMNEAELQTLILSHYENEAQTLTTGAEANLLKLKDMRGRLSEEEAQRWEDIQRIFLEQQRAKGYGQNGMGQAVATMEDISSSLRGIAEALRKR